MSPANIAEQVSSSSRILSAFGATIEILATSDETLNSFGMIRFYVPPKFPGAPLHFHEHMPESFLGLSGQIELLLDGQSRVLSAGDFALVPPKMVHGYRNPFGSQASFLVTAPGHDRFFFELIEWMRKEPVWPPADKAELVAFGKRHDTFYV